MRGFYRKKRIVDEEADWFAPGARIPFFTLGELPFGVAICADIGSHEVFAAWVRQGARIVFEAAAPGLHGDMRQDGIIDIFVIVGLHFGESA